MIRVTVEDWVSGAPDVKDCPDWIGQGVITGANNVTTFFPDGYDLGNCVTDDSPDWDLLYDIQQSNPGLINCWLYGGNPYGNRLLDCNTPAENQEGVNTITLTATDRGGLHDSDVFDIKVVINGLDLDYCQDPVIFEDSPASFSVDLKACARFPQFTPTGNLLLQFTPRVILR